MPSRLILLALCVAALGVSLGAGSQNPPPPPVPPTPVIQGGRGVVGGIAGPVFPGSTQPGRSSVPPAPLVSTSVIVGRVVDAASSKGVSGAVVTLQGGPPRTAIAVQPGAPGLPPAPQPLPPQILTDAEGRFAFMNLTRGNYVLTATKAGYAPGGFGRLRPNGPTRNVQLDDGEKMNDVPIRIFKFGSIAGTVIDDGGEPVVSTVVRVYRRVLNSGRRVLVQTGNQVQTDDRGAYRIPNLTPGEYIVVAPVVPITVPAAQGAARSTNMQQTGQGLSAGSPTPGAGGQAIGPDNRFLLQRINTGMSGDITAALDPSGRVTGFSTVYYANTPTASGAQILPIASGEERSGVDLVMRRLPLVSLSGVIVGPDGPAGDYVIRLIASDTGDIVQEPEAAIAMSDGSGSFMFLGVPTGQYVLQAIRVPRPAPSLDTVRVGPVPSNPSVPFQAVPPPNIATAPTMEPLLWTTAPVSVGDADIQGLSLTLREGLTVAGRLEFAGSRPRPEPQRLTQTPIVIEPADGRMQQFSSGPPSRVQPDGRFVTTGQLPGKYFLRVSGAPAGWTVQSISANGVDAMDAPIELSTTNISNVVVTFTDQIQDVRGTVSGLRPDSDPPGVIVFPADSNAWKNFGINPTRMRMSRAAPTGQFGLGQLPAGEYFAVAIADEYTSEWQDPAYLELLSRTALRFSLSPGERKTLDVPIQDVKPPSMGRRPAPNPGPLPLDFPDAIEDQREHGPFVPLEIEEDAQQTRDTRAAPPVGAGSISGVVRVDDGTNAPARFARVSVRSSTSPGERNALTDNEGRYVVPGVPAGSYQVFVTKPAYLSMYYGARRSNASQGIAVKVAAGQAVSGIDLKLQRGAVVTGVVIGVDGEPAPGVRVQLHQRLTVDGEPRLTGAATTGQPVTDDHGMFRLFGIRPGSYALSATPPNAGGISSEVRQLSDQEMRSAIAAATNAKAPASSGARILAPAPPGPLPTVPPSGRPVGYSMIYYPGTPIEDEAGIFTLIAGQEMRVGINLQLFQTARVEGTVVTADGQPVPVNGAQVMLQRTSGTASMQWSVRMTEAGSFQAIGVPPGKYQVTVRWTEQPPRPATPTPQAVAGIQWFAQQEVDVAGVDISGVNLTLGPPSSFSGKVVFDGPPPPGDAQVQVRLDTASRVGGGSFARALKPGDNGEFTITGVTPGRYRLTAFVTLANSGVSPTGPPAWSIKSATVDGRDGFETPFEIQAGRALTNAVVTMSTRLPQLSATITDRDGKNVPNMVFVLFPTNRQQWTGSTSRRVRSQTRPTDDGVYLFTSVLPGEYYLVVLTDLDPPDLWDPAYLEQLIPAGIRITLVDGDKRVQNLRVAGG